MNPSFSLDEVLLWIMNMVFWSKVFKLKDLMMDLFLTNVL